MKRFAIALVLGLALRPGDPAHAGTSAGSTTDSLCDFEHRIVYGTSFQPAEPCGGRPLNLVVHSCAECDHIIAGWNDGAIHLRFLSRRYCPRIPCQAESLVIPLGTLEAGTHQFLVLASARVLLGTTDSTTCEVSQQDTLTVRVGFCPPLPPPPPGPLPFVTQFRIGTPTPCLECPPLACPNDSIPVFIAGAFPDGCWSLLGVELLPSPIAGPQPQPPVVRINAIHDCTGGCPLVVVPWQATVKLPALPPGPYTLLGEEAWYSACDPTRIDSLFHANFPFRVVERCTTVTPQGCFLVDWQHGREVCDTFVDREHPGQVTMTALSNTVPIAGLQGTLFFYPAGLRITDLTPVGAASTWKVAWQPTANGAKFVMFSTDGTLIPDTDPVYPPSPVLRVTVATAGDEPRAPLTHLSASEMIASDPRGQDIPGCPILTLVQPEARICFAGQSCDLNHDGGSDVRDLVLMVHCINGGGLCPDSTTAVLDCNGDGQATLDDVFCCASVVLHGSMPGSTPGRSEPAVQVSFGAPVSTAGGLDVPLRIEGVDLLGAARLALRFPSDRFEVGGVDLPAGVSEWLGLHAVDGPDLLVGLIRVGSQEIARGTLHLTMHLALKAGQQAGGELRLASGDFSGPDAAALEVNFVPVTLPIGAGSRLSLSAAQPSPFPRETRFSLTLPGAADVELAVHDLAGRRIATLFRGRLAAGTRGFRWAGADDGGAPVRDGIYFLHARAASDEVTRKVILLRGN